MSSVASRLASSVAERGDREAAAHRAEELDRRRRDAEVRHLDRVLRGDDVRLEVIPMPMPMMTRMPATATGGEPSPSSVSSARPPRMNRLPMIGNGR